MTDTIIRKANHKDVGYDTGVPYQQQYAVDDGKGNIKVVKLDTETDNMADANSVWRKKTPVNLVNDVKATDHTVAVKKNIEGSNAIVK